MAVSVERNLDARMAHLIADVRRCLAIRNKLESKEVAQIVKAGALHAGAFGDRQPDFRIKLVRIDETTAFTRKQECGIGVAGFQVSQQFHYALGCCNASDRPTGLRWPQPPFPFMGAIAAAAFRNGVLDADFIIEPSYIEESKAERLVPPYPTEGADVGDWVADAAHILGGVYERPGLFRRRRRDLPGFKRR